MHESISSHPTKNIPQDFLAKKTRVVAFTSTKCQSPSVLAYCKSFSIGTGFALSFYSFSCKNNANYNFYTILFLFATTLSPSLTLPEQGLPSLLQNFKNPTGVLLLLLWWLNLALSLSVSHSHTLAAALLLSIGPISSATTSSLLSSPG